METPPTLSKSELAEIYEMSLSTLSRLLNGKYYDRLKVFDYKKADTMLSPNVVREFIRIYGKPLTDEDFK